MRCLLYSFAFLCLSWLSSPSHAQVAPSKIVLVISGDLKQGNFELHRYEGDGEQNTSSASGPDFFSSGGTLEEIFTELWPDNEFKIARKFGEDVFTLRINTSTPLDQAILSQIWNQFDQHADFVGTESSSSRTGNCLEVNSQAQLDTYGYIPSNGVLKRDESNKSEIELDGYTLSELARKLGQNRRLGAFYVQQKSTSSVYSFRLDASSMDTLKESLKAHGIVMKPCSRSISVYELR